MTDFLQTRGRQEQAERERLSRFAVFSSQTRGRRHNEPEHTYRTCFQRDRDQRGSLCRFSAVGGQKHRYSSIQRVIITGRV